jgi:eukaryotic-like serine/threonine-protein kinase
MTADRWRQVEQVFQTALEHRNPGDRAAYLDSACTADPDLRAEVDRMLTGHEEAAPEFLETPAAELAARVIASESRPISPGAMIGPYQIQSLLGSGGMGEVYKARDTRLGRTVAVKVLPPRSMPGSGEAPAARFLREAQAASALNNSHIVTIYDIVSEGGRDSIVMEFLDGSTLDVLIARKQLNLRETIHYGIEIADALAAAHAAGIVHRDIKPGNIMAVDTGSGERSIKVLDFGLAKQAVDGTEQTQEGLVMGTVAYMSPEQAEGKKVDSRSDIFSFGAVLYEMTTGRAAFHGDSGASTVAAILRDEPTPARSLVPGIPRELDWVINLCLKKLPQRRWQSMPDLRAALEEALEQLDTREPAAAGPEPKKQVAGWWWRPATAALAALVLAAAAGGYWLGSSTNHPSQTQYQRLTFRRGDVTSARFTPDGQTIIYSAEWDLEPSMIFSTRVESRESRPLGFPPGRILAISSAGEMAILSGTFAGTFHASTLSRAPLAGGAPREVLDGVTDADWADSENLAVVRTGEDGKSRVEFPIGKIVFSVERQRAPYSLRVSPKGDGLAFLNQDSEVRDYTVVYVSRNGGAPKVLSRGWRGVAELAWSPDGSEIWFVGAASGGEPALRAVTLSGRERVIAYTPGWMALYDVARDGRVLVAHSNSRIAMVFGARPKGKLEERDLSWLDTSWIYDISADGGTLLFVEVSYGENRNPAIYVRKTDGSPAVRLGNCARPSLSPDAKSVACIHFEGSKAAVRLLPVGAGEIRELPTDGFHYDQIEWMPDGRHILFSGSKGGAGNPARSFVQAIDNQLAPKPVTPEGITVSRVSPDSKTGVSLRSGSIYLQDLSQSGTASRRISAGEPGEFPVRWSTDGRSFFTAVRQGTAAFRVYRIESATGQKRVWKELKSPDTVGVTMFSLVLTPDGESYAYSYQRDLSDLYLISHLQ